MAVKFKENHPKEDSDSSFCCCFFSRNSLLCAKSSDGSASISSETSQVLSYWQIFSGKLEGASMSNFRSLIFLWFCCFWIRITSSVTDNIDVSILQALKNQWQNVPPSWGNSNDPCGSAWEGVTCTNSRVTALKLASMGLVGKLDGDIGGLSEFTSLDLSYNLNLTGSFSPRLGDLKNLNILTLAGCGFSGTIPEEIGNLTELTFLALNTNKFTGTIPSSFGKLSKLN